MDKLKSIPIDQIEKSEKKTSNIFNHSAYFFNQYISSFLSAICILHKNIAFNKFKFLILFLKKKKNGIINKHLLKVCQMLVTQSVVCGPVASHHMGVCHICRISGPTPDQLNRNFQLNKIPRCFLCTLHGHLRSTVLRAFFKYWRYQKGVRRLL